MCNYFMKQKAESFSFSQIDLFNSELNCKQIQRWSWPTCYLWNWSHRQGDEGLCWFPENIIFINLIIVEDKTFLNNDDKKCSAFLISIELVISFPVFSDAKIRTVQTTKLQTNKVSSY